MTIRNTILSLLFLVAAPSGCDTAVDDPTPRSETNAPSQLGLTDEELTLVWELTDIDGSLDGWLEHHRRPFDCADTGDLCNLVGKQAAREILHESYVRIIDGQSVDEVQGWLETEIQAVAADTPEPEVAFRAYLQSFNQHGNARTRVRAYTIQPSAPFQGYAYAQCKHQTRKNSGAPWINRTANHIASVRSRRTTTIGNSVLNGPAIPSTNGYTQNNGTGVTVTSGKNYHGTGPWSLPLGGESNINARACCQTFGEGNFPENIWCEGSAAAL